MEAFRLAKCRRINVQRMYRLFSSLSNRHLKHVVPQEARVEVCFFFFFWFAGFKAQSYQKDWVWFKKNRQKWLVLFKTRQNGDTITDLANYIILGKKKKCCQGCCVGRWYFLCPFLPFGYFSIILKHNFEALKGSKMPRNTPYTIIQKLNIQKIETLVKLI